MRLEACDGFLVAMSKLNEQSLCLSTQVVEVGTSYELFCHIILRNCLDPLQTEKNEITRGVLRFFGEVKPFPRIWRRAISPRNSLSTVGSVCKPRTRSKSWQLIELRQAVLRSLTRTGLVHLSAEDDLENEIWIG